MSTNFSSLNFLTFSGAIDIFSWPLRVKFNDFFRTQKRRRRENFFRYLWKMNVFEELWEIAKNHDLFRFLRFFPDLYLLFMTFFRFFRFFRIIRFFRWVDTMQVTQRCTCFSDPFLTNFPMDFFTTKVIPDGRVLCC